MNFKKMIFVLTIATSIVFACMLGGSYAYYTLSDGTSVNITTGDFDPNVAVIFAQSEYINMRTGVPISSSDVDSYANKSVFTLVPDSEALSGFEVAINVSITNLMIDEYLKTDDFKYDLRCNDGSSTTTLKSGTGTDFTSSDVIIGTLSTSDNTFSASKSYTCTLRLWLQETGENQNNLMNKSFSGLIKVNSMYRK